MRELEAFMTREGAGIGSFLGRIAKAEVETGFASLLELGSDGREPLDDWDDNAQVAAMFTQSEQGWLQDMLEIDEDLDDLEKALIAFIDAETGETFVPRP